MAFAYMQIDKKIKLEKVTKLLENNEIVALYQGASEAGPRALGNRSFLMSPIKEINKVTMNNVKGRELFRPLAASVLQEKANDWFDMLNIKESPYMSFSFEVREDKKNLVPAIVHVDNTCRIQTVTKSQNLYLYNIINYFYKKTKIPMLMNTSFNSKDEPIVESVDDAINCCKKINVKYIFFPQANTLISL